MKLLRKYKHIIKEVEPFIIGFLKDSLRKTKYMNSQYMTIYTCRKLINYIQLECVYCYGFEHRKRGFGKKIADELVMFDSYLSTIQLKLNLYDVFDNRLQDLDVEEVFKELGNYAEWRSKAEIREDDKTTKVLNEIIGELIALAEKAEVRSAEFYKKIQYLIHPTIENDDIKHSYLEKKTEANTLTKVIELVRVKKDTIKKEGN